MAIKHNNKQPPNSVSLIQVEGGYQVKQGDRSSVFAFQLVDERGQSISLDGEPAIVRLVKGEDYTIIYETTSTVEGNQVAFTIDKPIELGEVWLEIVAGGYVFPSDNRMRLRVTRSATVYGGTELFALDPMKSILELEKRQTYEHQQLEARKVWVIDHGLGKRPSVTVIDSAGNKVFGEVFYEGDNRIILTFTAEFSGSAILN